MIRSVSDALDILEQFDGDIYELGISELSRRLSIPKNKVFRILATLESRNYIEQNVETENYRLGFENLFLREAFVKRKGLLGQARSVQEALTRECNETSYVAVMQNFRVVCLNIVEPNLPVRVVHRVGEILPLYCTASGKVLAASLNNEIKWKQIFNKKLNIYTKNTIVDKNKLIEQLNITKRIGYSTDNQEFKNGVSCVCSPIYDYTRHVVGALTITGPSMRLNSERMVNVLIPLVKKSSAEISIKLGFQ